MIPTADILRTLLIDVDLGAELGDDWPLYVGLLPDDVDQALCLTDTSGIVDGRLMRTGERIEHPGVQLTVRSPSYEDGFAKAQDIGSYFDTLSGPTLVTHESVDYRIQNISRKGTVMPLGAEDEDKRRFYFSLNATVTIHQKE